MNHRILITFAIAVSYIASTHVTANTILFRSGGILNGQSVDGSGTIVEVEPGQLISGTLEISVENSHSSGAVVPVGGTVTWGDRESQLWEIDNHVYTGWTNISVGINKVAPTTPGLYYILIANRGECKYYQVMSATNWGVVGSPSYCGSLESGPIWNDGNDIGWDWSVEQFTQASSSGQITQSWWFPKYSEFREVLVGVNWVGIGVGDWNSETKKPEISVKDGFIKLDTTGGNAPLESDCDTTTHAGRMVYDDQNDVLYICGQAGWKVK